MIRSAHRQRTPAALGMALVLVALSAGASRSADAPETGLEPGSWQGEGVASGRAVATEDGIEVVWEGSIPATFDFTIDPRGAAAGTWEHGGNAVQTVRGSPGGQSVEARGELSYAGSGTVGGSDTELTLDGESRTMGVLRLTAGGIEQVNPVDNTSELPTLRMKVMGATCSDATGDWAYTVQEALEDEGFSASIDGTWSAVRGSSSNVQALLDLVKRAGEAYLAADRAEQLLGLAIEAEILTNELRNLSDCDSREVGEERLERYFSLLTLIIQGSVIHDMASSDPWGGVWQIYVELAARSGAIGAGAVDAEAAAATEQALIDEGSRILEESYDDFTRVIAATPEATLVMSIGAAMGWTFEVGGEPIDARAEYPVVFGGR